MKDDEVKKTQEVVHQAQEIQNISKSDRVFPGGGFILRAVNDTKKPAVNETKP